MNGATHSIYVGSDHAGFELKEKLIAQLKLEFPSIRFVDCGCQGTQSVDYPTFAEKVAVQVAEEQGGRGILICGSGLGMCIAANKVKGIRATSSWNVESAKLSREHNDSNIICLGARLIPFELALEAVRVWIQTPFLGARHANRLSLIQAIEEKQ